MAKLALFLTIFYILCLYPEIHHPSTKKAPVEQKDTITENHIGKQLKRSTDDGDPSSKRHIYIIAPSSMGSGIIRKEATERLKEKSQNIRKSAVKSSLAMSV